MDILSKLYTQSPQQAIHDIAAHREKNGYCVVHFLYFANMVSQDLWDINSRYRKLLQSADFLLPDGIALQIFYATAVMVGRIQSPRKWLANCNGTDLTLPLLQHIHHGNQVHMYGGTPTGVPGAAQFLRTHDILPVSVTHGWNIEFDWSKVDPSAKNILLLGR
jgi:UDP-N-acetyl-D-mannosaminuronic acid transferase (WecB/TagA/CpsF family)